MLLCYRVCGLCEAQAVPYLLYYYGPMDMIVHVQADSFFQVVDSVSIDQCILDLMQSSAG